MMNWWRGGASATLLPNGKVLIAGGYGGYFDGPSGYLSSTDLYNPVTNTFAAFASTPVMNAARSNATATLLPNGKVLIAGGYAFGALGSTELYDPATNTFAAAASTPVMNTARNDATATLLPNGQVLIAGGDNDSSSLSSTELYDPASNTFAAAASTPVMNTARFGATATLLPNGEVLIAGGDNGSLSSTELYNPAANTFAAAASTPVMNTARYDATATLLPNGRVLIAGGGNGSTYLSSTELYDPATNTFAAAASTPVMNTARELATATLLPNG